MVLVSSLREALRHLREQPILFVPMAIFAVLQAPQLFLDTLDPVASIVGSLVVTGVVVFVTPVFYAGTIGMANDAATGVSTSLGRFWSHAREHYVPVLLAYLFLTAVAFGFGIVISIAAIVAIVGVGAGGGGLGPLIGIGAVIALLVLAFLVVLFAVHLYAHAIVIEGTGPVGGLSRSVHVVRHNLRTMVGYGLLSLVVGGLFGGLFGLLNTFVFPGPQEPGEPAPTPDLVPALLGSGLSIVATALFMTGFVAFTVVLYRKLIDADGEPTGPNTTGRPDTAGREEVAIHSDAAPRSDAATRSDTTMPDRDPESDGDDSPHSSTTSSCSSAIVKSSIVRSVRVIRSATNSFSSSSSLAQSSDSGGDASYASTWSTTAWLMNRLNVPQSAHRLITCEVSNDRSSVPSKQFPHRYSSFRPMCEGGDHGVKACRRGQAAGRREPVVVTPRRPRRSP